MTSNPKPMSMYCLCSLFTHDGEWEPCGKCWIFLWEPLDVEAPEDARPYCQSFGIDFYDRNGNNVIARGVRRHDLMQASQTLVLVSGICYAVLSGRCMYRNGRWYMRWLAASNCREAHVVNAGWYAWHDEWAWIRPVRWLMSRIAYSVRRRIRGWVGRFNKDEI